MRKAPKTHFLTAVTGNYDEPRLDWDHQELNVVRHFGTDDPELQLPEGWNRVNLDGFDEEPKQTAKRLKILPHEFVTLEDGDIVVWADGTHVPLKPVKDIAERWLEDADFAHARHNTCRSLYHEIRTCLYHELSPAEGLRRLYAHLQDAGYPEKDGDFGTNTVLVMRWSRRLEALLEDWWALCRDFTMRDQCTFEFALAQHPQVPRRLVDVNIYECEDWSFQRHLPRIPEANRLTPSS